jgi:hypothetical protein
VQLKKLPKHENIRELKAAMWQWIENVCEREDHQEINPQTKIIDEN